MSDVKLSRTQRLENWLGGARKRRYFVGVATGVVVAGTLFNAYLNGDL